MKTMEFSIQLTLDILLNEINAIKLLNKKKQLAKDVLDEAVEKHCFYKILLCML